MQNRFGKWTLRVAAILFLGVLATTVMCSGLFARFVSFASGGDSARVAKFNFKVSQILYEDENDVVTDVTNTLSSGHNIYVDPGMRENASHLWYEYTVENDSEVTTQVTFKAKLTRNLPYRIYFAGSKVFSEIQAEYNEKFNMPANTNFNFYAVNYGDLTNYPGNKTITLAPGEKQTVYLWLDWANVDNNPSYDDLKDYRRSYEIAQLKITIECRQVD